MALLSKEDILAADDRTVRKVKVPEWGGEVAVATMTGAARDKFESSIIGKNGGMNTQNIRAKLVCACLVDADGKQLFKEEKDIIRLGNKSCAALDRVFAAAQELNRIGDTEVEELAKN